MSQTARADAIGPFSPRRVRRRVAGGLCRKRAQEAFKDPLQNSRWISDERDCERTTISERH